MRCKNASRTCLELVARLEPARVDPSRSLPRTGRETRSDEGRSLAALGMTERGEGLGMTERGEGLGTTEKV
jgi:hypothetical protein